MRDQLDHLLDTSAPAIPPTDSPVLQTVFAAMTDEAARQARPRRRRVKVLVGVGVGALLATGATAAAATGVFNWDGWAADPDIAYSFTLPSGRACEDRISVHDGSWDGDPTPSTNGDQVAALTEWARSTDFDTVLDVPANVAALDPADGLPLADEEAGRIHPDPNGPDAIMIVLGDDGHLDVVPRTTEGPDADSLYANAVERGLDQLIRQHAAQMGWETGWGYDLAVQCTVQ